MWMLNYRLGLILGILIPTVANILINMILLKGVILAGKTTIKNRASFMGCATQSGRAVATCSDPSAVRAACTTPSGGCCTSCV